MSNFKYSQAHYFFDKIILVAIRKWDVQIILSLPQFHRSFKNNPTLHNSTFAYLELYIHISVKSCSSPIISYFHVALFQVTQHIMAKDPLGKGNSRHVNKWDYILLMNIKSLKTWRKCQYFLVWSIFLETSPDPEKADGSLKSTGLRFQPLCMWIQASSLRKIPV